MAIWQANLQRFLLPGRGGKELTQDMHFWIPSCMATITTLPRYKPTRHSDSAWNTNASHLILWQQWWLLWSQFKCQYTLSSIQLQTNRCSRVLQYHLIYFSAHSSIIEVPDIQTRERDVAREWTVKLDRAGPKGSHFWPTKRCKEGWWRACCYIPAIWRDISGMTHVSLQGLYWYF